MNVNCVICTDLFAPTSDVVTTKCGHMFHSACLFQWLECSKTCPQCRNATKDGDFHKVYFNVVDAPTEDVPTLTLKLDSAEWQLKLSNMDVKNLREKNTELEKQTKGLRKMVREAENKSLILSQTISELQAHVRELKQNEEKCDAQEIRIFHLNKELDKYKAISDIVKSESITEEAILMRNSDAKTLAVIIATLKRELNAQIMKREKSRSAIAMRDRDIKQLKLQYDELKKSIATSPMRLSFSGSPSIVLDSPELERPFKIPRKRLGISKDLDSGAETNTEKGDDCVVNEHGKVACQRDASQKYPTTSSDPTLESPTPKSLANIKKSNVILSPSVFQNRLTRTTSTSDSKQYTVFKNKKQLDCVDLVDDMDFTSNSASTLGGARKVDDFPQPKLIRMKSRPGLSAHARK